MSHKYKLAHQEPDQGARIARKEEISNTKRETPYSASYGRKTGLRGIGKAVQANLSWNTANGVWTVFTVLNNENRAKDRFIRRLEDVDPKKGLRLRNILIRQNEAIHGIEDDLFQMPPTAESLAAIYGTANATNSKPFFPEELPPLSVHEYDDLFTADGIKPRERGELIFSDEAFANLAVAGANPVLIENVSKRKLRKLKNKGFEVGDFIFQTNSPFTKNGDDSLEGLASRGKLFLEDYSELEGFTAKEANEKFSKTYTFAPRVLYGVTKVGGKETLLPIAIQCRQLDTNGRADNDKILYPHTPNAVTYSSDLAVQNKDYTWQIAKTIALNASTSHHEMISHLALTHFMVEEFAMAGVRTLSDKHPLFGILRPHFVGTFARNFPARELLLEPNGLVDKTFGGTTESFTDGVSRAVKNYHFNQSYFPDLLKKRGVHPTQSNHSLPYYPYAQDGLAYWQAIFRYVDRFLDNYYESEDDYQKDLDLHNGGELGAFFHELRTEQYTDDVRLRAVNVDIPENLHEYKKFVTQMIFITSVQHAAINTSQRDRVSNPASQPAAVFRPAPQSFGQSRQDYMELLPPFDIALSQVTTSLTLSFRHTAMSALNTGQIVDKESADYMAIDSAMRHFKTDLKIIERDINHRNNSLPKDHWYQYLLPDLVPQSINS